jgi:hypothetical protein
MFKRAGAVPAMTIDACQFDEGVERIVEFFNSANDAQGFDMPCEPGPGLVTVFAGEDKLGICKGDSAGPIQREVAKARVVFADARECGREASAGGTAEFFGLFPILFEAGVIGEDAVGHTKLLSSCAWSVRIDQAERRFVKLEKP